LINKKLTPIVKFNTENWYLERSSLVRREHRKH